MLKKIPSYAWATAASTFTSSMIMLALFPPSSRVTLFNPFRDDFYMISRPTSVDPVKATLSTSGWLDKCLPAVSPNPERIFTTPSGKPASWMSSPTLNALRGVYSAVFMTTVHPAASAGPSFHACMRSGKFHGII